MALAAAAVPEARFAVGDAQDLGPVDALGGPFAVVAAVQLLTHVANPLKLLREAARVAVPGGTLVMTVWGRDARVRRAGVRRGARTVAAERRAARRGRRR